MSAVARTGEAQFQVYFYLFLLGKIRDIILIKLLLFTGPFDSVYDVISETKEKLRMLAPGGGLILGTANNVQAQLPIENIMAFCNTVNKFGSYPIRL